MDSPEFAYHTEYIIKLNLCIPSRLSKQMSKIIVQIPRKGREDRSYNR